VAFRNGGCTRSAGLSAQVVLVGRWCRRIFQIEVDYPAWDLMGFYGGFLWDFSWDLPGLVNIPKYIYVEHHHFYKWVNQLCRLGHVQVRKLWVYQRVSHMLFLQFVTNWLTGMDSQDFARYPMISGPGWPGTSTCHTAVYYNGRFEDDIEYPLVNQHSYIAMNKSPFFNG
jgi:hypothetical protein